MHATKGNLHRMYNVLAIAANTIKIRAETLSFSGPSSTSILLLSITYKINPVKLYKLNYNPITSSKYLLYKSFNSNNQV